MHLKNASWYWSSQKHNGILLKEAVILFQLFFSYGWNLEMPEVYRRRWYITVPSKEYVLEVGLGFFHLTCWQLPAETGYAVSFGSSLTSFNSWDLQNCKLYTYLDKIFLALYLCGTTMKPWKGIFRNVGFKSGVQTIISRCSVSVFVEVL